jgi:hypothetical protein
VLIKATFRGQKGDYKPFLEHLFCNFSQHFNLLSWPDPQPSVIIGFSGQLNQPAPAIAPPIAGGLITVAHPAPVYPAGNIFGLFGIRVGLGSGKIFAKHPQQRLFAIIQVLLLNLHPDTMFLDFLKYQNQMVNTKLETNMNPVASMMSHS